MSSTKARSISRNWHAQDGMFFQNTCPVCGTVVSRKELITRSPPCQFCQGLM